MRCTLILWALNLLVTARAYEPNGSPGCHPLWAQTADDGNSQVLKIGTSSNGVREYILDLPSTWKARKPSPLIITFHGKNQENDAFKQQTQLSNPALNGAAIVAYPKGIDKQWTGDPTSPSLTKVNDIEFAGQLIDHISHMYCVDTRRIYAVGFSNGGGLAQLLACDKEISKQLAAVAIASGAFYFDYALKDALFSLCTPGRTPVPIIEFHGANDPVIDYHGKATPDGQTYDIADWGPSWADRNECVGDREGEKRSLYNDAVEKTVWKCGSSKETVVHYRITNFGHGWPSTQKQDDDFQRYGPAPFNATPIILEFLNQHTLPEVTKTFRDEL